MVTPEERRDGRREVPVVFTQYTIEEIARATGYTSDYIRMMRLAPQRISRTFRARVSDALGRPSAELFDQYTLVVVRGRNFWESLEQARERERQTKALSRPGRKPKQNQ